MVHFAVGREEVHSLQIEELDEDCDDRIVGVWNSQDCGPVNLR